MPDYKSMYFRLFNQVTAVISLLQQGQQQTEDSYILNFPPPEEEANMKD